MSTETFLASWRAGALAAVLVPRSDRLRAEVAVPLATAEQPVLALPFDRTGLAEDLAEAGTATLVCWDSRMALRGWTPVAGAVRVEVTQDRAGRWIDDGLLEQELHHHPPSRALLDTPLLRREHWWYVPRWIVRAVAIERTWEVVRREGPRTGLLGWSSPDGHVDAGVVEVDRWDGGVLALRPRSPTAAAPPAGAEAVLLACDVRTPELDPLVTLQLRGRLTAGPSLEVVERSGQGELDRMPSLWRRLRAAAERERACRRAIAAADTRDSRRS